MDSITQVTPFGFDKLPPEFGITLSAILLSLGTAREKQKHPLQFPTPFGRSIARLARTRRESNWKNLSALGGVVFFGRIFHSRQIDAVSQFGRSFSL